MGKLREYPNDRQQKPQHSKTLKPKQTMKKAVKVTYISSPLMVRACDASEFREVVQELTGKNSINLVESPDSEDPTLILSNNKEEAVWISPHEALHETMPAEAVNATSYNRMGSLEFDEGCFWREIVQNMSMSGLQSPCVLV